MPHRDRSGPPRPLIRPAILPLAAAAALVLAAAGSAGAQGWLDGFKTFDVKEFFTYHGDKEKEGGSSRQSGGRRIFCPEIVVLDGTAAAQFYAGQPPSNQNLRHQFAITDAVRECAMQDDKVAFKVGVAGNVLLGPAGAPGSFSIPVRVAVVDNRDNEPVVSKLYHVTASIPQNEAQAQFSLVTEPLAVPFFQDHTEDDYTIKVGLDEGPQKAAGKSK